MEGTAYTIKTTDTGFELRVPMTKGLTAVVTQEGGHGPLTDLYALAERTYHGAALEQLDRVLEQRKEPY